MQAPAPHIASMSAANTLIPGPPPPQSDLLRLGGIEGVRRIIDTLVDQMVQDVMIGFFFAHVDRRKLKLKEAAYAASHLGGPAYKGRDVPQAHRQVAIGRGHFLRRLKLLQEVLTLLQVPEDIGQRWLAHQRGLLPQFLNAHEACPQSK